MGLQRTEAAGAQLADYDPESGSLRSGRGIRARLARASAGAKRALDDWIAARGTAPGPLLAPVSKSGIVQAGAGITPHALMLRLQRRAKQAGIPHCTTLDLRRTFAAATAEATKTVTVAVPYTGAGTRDPEAADRARHATGQIPSPGRKARALSTR